MKTIHLLFVTSFSLMTLAQAAGGRAQPDFERLIDVDYEFFSTKARIPWGSDPFLKEPGYAQVPAVEQTFVLNGILYSESDPAAIVNGKHVEVGDRVADRQVAEIGANYVILKRRDSEIELNLPPIRGAEAEADDDTGEKGVSK